MNSVWRAIGLFLLLLVAAVLVFVLLTAGGAAAQDETPTATPAGGAGQNPLATPTGQPGGPGQDPLRVAPADGSSVSGGGQDNSSNQGADSGACLSALVPITGLAVFGPLLARRRRQ